MRWFSPLCRLRFGAIFAGSAFAILIAGPQRGYADDAVNTGRQIEYISPDGKSSSLSTADLNGRQSNAAFVDNDTISCTLKEGETTFIIELPKNIESDRLTFLNENADACGELRIAVSNSALPADSPKWTEVDGIVPFAHKRLFKLSMLGVETKFVRLSFRVDSEEKKSATISQPFGASILTAGINSNFAKLFGQDRELNLASISVAPLPSATAK